MSQHALVRVIRVFVSSPGDVAKERSVLVAIVERSARPFFFVTTRQAAVLYAGGT